MPTQTPWRHEGDRAGAADRRDIAYAAGAALLALVVYIRTLAPGLVGVLDTPMFQFIGRVLGVAHNPGYPLYVFLTFPFSYLPIGSLAYRINLFSALLGAIAVSLTYLLARRLDCRRPIALMAALGLAFGAVFWSQAVIAEVYTLHAALVAGILLALIVWSDTRREAYFYTAVALFAAGLGNHTTLVGFAPGMVIFVLLTDSSFALRWKTVAAAAAILALGLMQYAFVLVRSLDPQAYVESRATTLAALLDVMMAGQFRDRLFSFGWRTVVFERLPFLFERVLVPELTLPALCLAVIGIIWLLWRRLARALLLLLGMTAILVFTLNYSVVDTPVFVIPAILVLWIAAGVGAERLVRLAERVAPAVRTGGVVAAATLVIPAYLLATNFAGTDRSRETTSAVYLDALFNAFPDGSAVVHEDFLVDRMVVARLFGEDATPDRPINFIDREVGKVKGALSSGRPVFGFNKSARRLRYDALDFSFAPQPLLGGGFDDYLERLPRGIAVAIAVPSAYASRFASVPVSIAAVGGTATRNRLIAAGRSIGNSDAVARAVIDLEADAATAAAIRVDNRDIVRTTEGVAVAVFAADGRVDEAFVLQPGTNWRVPLPIGPLSIYVLRSDWRGEEIDQDAWRDVTEAGRTGSLMLRVPAGRTVTLYAADNRPLEPRVFDKSQDRISVRTIEVMPGFIPRGHLYRMSFGVTSARTASVLVALGGIPSRVVARLAPATRSTDRASIFSLDLAGLLRTPDDRSELLLMARDEQSQLVGDGWSPVDFDVVGPYRWMTATEAALVMPVAGSNPTHIRVQALRRADRDGPTSIALRVNETVLPVQPIAPGWHAYEWNIPRALIHQGTNEMAIIVDRPPANQTVAVAEVRLERRQ